MACTALKITKEDNTIVRVKFLTVWNPPLTDVDVFICNEEFMPVGNANMTTSDMDEESYHKKLRQEATEKGQFVPEESTDNHWNPGYVEPIEEEDGTENPV